MPEPPRHIYRMSRMHAAFAMASVALLASLLWLVKSDHDRPWRGWQDRYHACDNVLARSLGTPEADHGDTFNRPLVDQFTPRGTPGRHEIRQITLAEIENDLHFARGQRVDRCATCHVAVDDPRFTSENLSVHLPEISQHQEEHGGPPVSLAPPVLAHPRLDLYVAEDSPHPVGRMGCTVCHAGSGEETDFVLSGHRPKSPDERRLWEQRHYVRHVGVVVENTFDSAIRRNESPILAGEYAYAGCTQCHTQVADISGFDGQTISRPIEEGRFLFTTLGCANCHLVEELAEARKVGPDLSHVAGKLTRGFMHQWIWEPRRWRPSSLMPHFFLQENNDDRSDRGRGDTDPVLRTRAEVVAIVEYLRAVSEPAPPQNLPDELWADLRDEASPAVTAAAERGRQLLDSLGCLGCHAVLAHRPDDEDGNPGDPLGLSWSAEAMIRDGIREARIKDGIEPDEQEIRAIEDAAFLQAARMNLSGWAHMAMSQLSSDRDALFAPAETREPIFTRRAPELSTTRTRFATYRQAVEWLYTWLIAPDRHAPGTLMPNMRLGPTADQSMPKTHEALDLAVYLATLQPPDPAAGMAFDATADEADALARQREDLVGQWLARQRSHSKVDDKERLAALVLAGASSRSGATLDRLARAMATTDPAQQQWIYLGQRMIAHYGCFGCHRIPGFEDHSRVGPEMTEWADAPLARLDWGMLDPARPASARPHGLSNEVTISDPKADGPFLPLDGTQTSFATCKLLNTRVWDRGRARGPYEKLKMPGFLLAERERRSLVTFLLSRKPTAALLSIQIDYAGTPAGGIARGRNLARELNCVGCHRIDGNIALGDQYHLEIMGPDLVFDEIHAPPSLRGEGAKIRPHWLYGYLRQVDPLRPWLTARMPQFDLTDVQVTQIVDYLASLCQTESAWLNKQLAGMDAALPPPLASYAARHRLLPAHLLDPRQVDAARYAEACAEARDDAAFLQRLLDISYPFTEPLPGNPPPSQLADGRALFIELECLACHVFGNPGAPGANTKPTAQNLSLVADRLPRRWSRAWLEAPSRIQPGTKMPTLFGTGGVSAFAEYPPAARDHVRGLLDDPSLLDDGPRQIDAIIAFMYDAAARRLDVVQPGGVTPK